LVSLAVCALTVSEAISSLTDELIDYPALVR
jgi:hypothetical protein